MATYHQLIDPVCTLCATAAQAIMPYFRLEGQQAQLKADNSPVTQADFAAHQVIVEHLAKLTPNVPIVSEENEQQPDVRQINYYWLVDPLDGTKAFLNGSEQFTINIGLIEKGIPVLGFIYVPVKRLLYYGSYGVGAYVQKPNDAPRRIHVRPRPHEGATVLVSHSHMSPETEAFLKQIDVEKKFNASSSVKFCHVAEGTADLYPRFGRTMEWDTAAGHAILNAAGGRIETPAGSPLLYGKPEFVNSAFIAYGGNPLPVEKPAAS